MKKMMKEFKEFISKGNVLDWAVKCLIGGAFGKIVTSLVDNIIMPLVGLVCGGVNFAGLHFQVKDAVIYYGAFLQNVVDFLIVAFCIFIFIKFVNKLNRKKAKEEEKVEAPKKSEEVILLEQIRDELKKRK